ncbi:MAG: response regulator, partial [Pseudomonadota bacterium]|nr:response regulator [Pseudomonadota bacterium]
MHALIIEDDYLIGQTIQDMLGDLGFARFSFATSESAAIAAAASGEKFDLITADARLLPGNGVKAVEVICEHRKIPVVFITGYPEELRK